MLKSWTLTESPKDWTLDFMTGLTERRSGDNYTPYGWWLSGVWTCETWQFSATFSVQRSALSASHSQRGYMTDHEANCCNVCLQPHPLNRPYSIYLLSWHVLYRTFYPFCSTHRNNQPRFNTRRVPTAEVRFFFQLCLSRLSLVSNHASWPTVTVHALCRSTSSTMIHSLKCFISIDRPSLTETRMIISVSEVGGDGIAKDGGTNSHKFVKDGET